AGPQGGGEAETLSVVGDAGEAVLTPAVGSRARLVVREIRPRVAGGAVVLAHGPPLPLAQVRTPLPPWNAVGVGFGDASVLGVAGHGRNSSQAPAAVKGLRTSKPIAATATSRLRSRMSGSSPDPCGFGLHATGEMVLLEDQRIQPDSTEGGPVMNLVSLLISLLSGAVGGNIAGSAMPDKSLGTAGNSLAGIFGGGLGAVLLQ